MMIWTNWNIQTNRCTTKHRFHNANPHVSLQWPLGFCSELLSFAKIGPFSIIFIYTSITKTYPKEIWFSPPNSPNLTSAVFVEVFFEVWGNSIKAESRLKCYITPITAAVICKGPSCSTSCHSSQPTDWMQIPMLMGWFFNDKWVVQIIRRNTMRQRSQEITL